MRHPKRREPLAVTIGFAAREDGRGVAYASYVPRTGSGRHASPVRVGFACRPQPVLRGRDLAYAALTAVAGALLARDIREATLRIDDASLPRDLEERGSLPTALVIPYVALRCKLNAFHDVHVVAAADETTRDLTGRARAEIALQTAA